MCKLFIGNELEILCASLKIKSFITYAITLRSVTKGLKVNHSSRHYLQGVDMTISDYDGRTALHLAAAEGQEGAVKFLLETCQVPPNPKDRFSVCSK